ncbi:MAG: tRNA pseudouridine(55) synthase TruB [Coriobacteriaceae bacterium]|nr:tRNA pseudouridine(55) synthase TruB [Coriobacteriaceae bacterium]
MAKRKPSELNLLLAVDKPVGITSHDVVAQVRRALGERRVGHAGTLDPLASGVMVVGVGQATRLLGRVTLDRKCYVARIAFGCETATDDAEGEVTRMAEVSDDVRSPMFARSLLKDFLGEQEQVPPAYSAISVDGVRSYKRARAGEDVELPARTIEVFAADLVAIDEGDGTVVWTCAFDVSKGTYIRSLARDIGRAAGCAAHICDLRRTSSGCVSSGMCLRIEDITVERAHEKALNPAAVLGLPVSELTEQEAEFVKNGRSISRDRALKGQDGLQASDAEGVALAYRGELRAIGLPHGGSLAMDLVFPQGIEGVGQ